MIANTRSRKDLLIFFLYSFCSSFVFFAVSGQVNDSGRTNDGVIDDAPFTVTLSNGLILPLVGLGVGNLHQHLVESMVNQGLNDDLRTRLIDTAHASGNEREVARGITTGIKDLKKQLAAKDKKNRNNKIDSKQRVQVHVVTKIWYTHLGYERTKLAINDILENFEEAIKDPNVDLKLTILLHWPQCYDSIPWMNCEEEEEQLPDRVKNAGPPPHLEKENAFKGSWRALEDAYEKHISHSNNKTHKEDSVIASIGISNFNYFDLKTLLETCTITPHLAQINLWSLLNEQRLIELMNANKIYFQVYNVMNGIIGNVIQNPKAHHHILMVGNQLKQKYNDERTPSSSTSPNDFEMEQVLFTQVILSWLVQFDISIIPRTSDSGHLTDNSAVSLSRIPSMSREQVEVVGRSMAAIINNEDLKEDVKLQVRFHAKESDMFLYWVPDEGDSERQLAFIEKGSSYEESTHPGHTFKLYHAYDPDQFETFSIRGHYGEIQDVHVEL